MSKDDPGADWPTDPNDAEGNTRWMLEAILRITPEALEALQAAEERGDVAEVNRLLSIADISARARLGLARKGAAA